MIRIAVVTDYNTDKQNLKKIIDLTDTDFLRIPFIGDTIADEYLNEYKVLEVIHYIHSDMKVYLTVEPLLSD